MGLAIGPFAQVLAYTSIPVLATIGGGTIAAYRAPGPRLRSGIQHFAAGVVFAAVAVELLPGVIHERSPIAAVFGFALGIATLLAVKRFTARLGEPVDAGTRGESVPVGLIATLGIDIGIDGLLLGIGFAAGAKQGILLTIALTLELLFLGLAAATALGAAGIARRKAIGVVVGLAVILLAGAAVGSFLFGGLSGAPFEAVLSFGVAALLYLVTEELLVEAHEIPETAPITAAFFAGFLLLLIIDMVA
jgi:ZIP family zinc transporter